MAVLKRHTGVWAAVAILLALAGWLAVKSTAANAQDGAYSEGTPGKPFLLDSSGGSVDRSGAGGDESLLLRKQKLWEYKPSDGLEPRGLHRVGGAPDGRTLIANGNFNRVIEVDKGGVERWSYDRRNSPWLDRIWAAQRLANGNTLIVSRGGGGRGAVVLEVTPAKSIAWQYGSVDETSLAPGHLADPFQATRLANGNTLIVDGTAAGNRVIEVKTSDYRAGAPDLGYTASSIVWQYGHGGDNGMDGGGENPADGYLNKPKSAQRLSNGNTLIADEFQVIVVSHDAAPHVVWRFGKDDLHDADLASSFAPTHASQPIAGLTVLVSGSRAGSYVIGLSGSTVGSSGKSIAWRLGPGPVVAGGEPLVEPRCAQRLSDGRVLIADQGNQRLLEVGYPGAVSVTSQSTDFSLPGVPKYLSRLTWHTSRPAGTSIALSYSLNGGQFRTAGSTGGYTFPSSTKANTVKYRATLKTTNRWATPVLRDVAFEYSLVPPPPPTSSDPPATGNTGSDSGSSGSASSGDSSGGDSGSSTSLGGSGTGGGGTGGGTGTGAGRGSAKTGPQDRGGVPGGMVKEVPSASGMTQVVHRGFVLERVGSGNLSAGGAGEGLGAPFGVQMGGLAALVLLYAGGAATAGRGKAVYLVGEFLSLYR